MKLYLMKNCILNFDFKWINNINNINKFNCNLIWFNKNILIYNTIYNKLI